MARYSRTFSDIRRAKAADYQARRHQAIALLAVLLWYR